MIELNKKYGCLTVLDMGEEWADSDARSLYESEYKALMKQLDDYENVAAFGSQDEKRVILEQHPGSSFAMGLRARPSGIDTIFERFVRHESFFIHRKLRELEKSLGIHYKCQCRCGKVRYYDEKTIESEPRFCFYPIAIRTKHTYSVKAENATYRKKQQYTGINSVVLCDKSECVPKPEYCDLYNKSKLKQFERVEAALAERRSRYDVCYASDYDVDLTDVMHETLRVVRRLGDKSVFYDSGKYVDIISQWECVCELCGKVHVFRPSAFDINPPTVYGYRAYHGYWSEAKCDCHPISSFQWIVTKLLKEYDVKYRAEVCFDGLYGIFGQNYLRFDFCIFNSDNTVKCLIECQGEQHSEAVEKFGGESGFLVQQQNDAKKCMFCNANGIRLVEIVRVKRDLTGYVERILRESDII